MSVVILLMALVAGLFALSLIDEPPTGWADGGRKKFSRRQVRKGCCSR